MGLPPAEWEAEPMRGNVFWKGLVILLIFCLLAAGIWFLCGDSRELYAGATLVRRWEECLGQTNCM